LIGLGLWTDHGDDGDFGELSGVWKDFLRARDGLRTRLTGRIAAGVGVLEGE
jgi:hypothetical protein